jgi:hypothetical protein
MKRFFTAGLAAAKTNLLPGLVLQVLMVVFFLGYLFVPAVREGLEALAVLKTEVGYWYALVAGALAGGVMPELLRVTLMQRFRFQQGNAVNLIFGAAFWGVMGVVVDAFYRLQALWFGTDPTPGTVVSKVLVDMLVFTPGIGVPAAAIAYAWRHTGFRWSALPEMFSLGYYNESILPVLLPNWVIWTPVVCIIYSLPPGLQIPLYIFAQAFWALVLMTLTKHVRDAA